MTISERRVGSAVVLDISGPLAGPDEARKIESTVRRHGRNGVRTLIANLGGVPSVDLGGLGALVEGSRVMRELGGALRLVRITRRIHDLIVITRLLTVFDTFDSVEDAVAGMTGESRELAPALSPATLGVINRFLRRA
jgi:anti-sigma B factor antagonist